MNEIVSSLLLGHPICNRFLDAPLFPNSRNTTREWITGYIEVFLNKATSKQSLSDTLSHTQSKLPIPNHLPRSYAELISLISAETITIHKKHVCVQECMFFTGDQRHCTHCGRRRFKDADTLGRLMPQKIFSHTSLKEMLNKLFGCSNIAQVVQAAGGLRRRNLITDITETQQWEEWMETENDELKIVLGLNTDGVSPFSGGKQYSCWPLLISIMNLPKYIRTKSDALLLYGVAPSRDSKKGKGTEPDLHIYQQLMVDELLELVSFELFSAYRAGPITVKVDLLVYMLDFQGYSKYFKMSGAVSMLPCNICMIRSHQVNTGKGFKRAILGHDNLVNLQRNSDIEVGSCVLANDCNSTA